TTAERDACREERETLERHLHDLTGRKAEASEGHRARATALDALRRRRAETAAAIAGLDERRLAGRAEITRLEEVIARADATKRDLGARRTALDEQRAAGRATDAEDGSMEAVAEELRRREAALGRAKAALAAMEEDHRRCAEHRRAAEANAARRHEALSLAEAEAARTAEVLAEIETFARTRLARAADVLLADEALQAELAAADMSELEEKLLRLRAARERIGPVNLRAAAEVEERGAEAAALRREEGELRAAVERLKRGIGALDREARERLKEIFEKVDEHFRRLFVQLFGGGKAHLRLTNLDDPLAAGLELDAMPPGKKLQNISLLSGGEKTLTALALVFAFFLAQPSPLCVLDEVDAALDDANVERFVDLMEGIARDTGTRFIVVTHHPFTMARMDRLFGVTMIERGVSRLVSVALDEAVELRASA
ncbi:MAG: AAA family ATPase, partial [Geminicoccaceae bacterium]|nr:AAA family ATPase [Geminicoccaceae bacterium]